MPLLVALVVRGSVCLGEENGWQEQSLRGFPPIATKILGITTNLGAIGGFYGTETVILL